jgi:hypothetical protein
MKASLKVGAFVVWALFSGGLASCGRASQGGPNDEPGACQRDADCKAGLRCHRDLEVCVGCVDDVDCVGLGTCVDSECQAATGGAGAGDGGSAGAGNEPDPGDGGTGGVGNGGTGGQPSEPEVCEPGSRVCHGPNVERCSGDGSHWTIDDTCSLTQVCSSGACRDIECVPHRKLCRDNQIWECGGDGTTAELVKHCKADQYCLEDDGDASCSATVCVPSDPLCDGPIASHCKPDGSGSAAGGQNCAESGEICYDGECRARACTPGEKLCQHGDVYLCIEGGSNIALFSACAETESCNATLGACVPRICVPGTKTCDATRVQVCNASGTGWETATECALENAICVEGSCRTKLCIPNTEICNNDAAYTCDPLGIEYKLKENCGAGRYCASSGSWAYCQTSYCLPGETLCSSGSLATCNENGNTDGAAWTPCGAGNVCAADSKSCTPQLCPPGSYFCKDHSVSWCWYDGLTSSISWTCPDTAFCDATNGATCTPFDCQPKTTACLGNQIGICGADGLSLATVSNDCTKSGDVCDTALGCVSSTVDQLGAAEKVGSYATGQVLGNSIDVLSTRKLTKLEARLVIAGALDLHWQVYERTPAGYVSKHDNVVTDQTGSGYFSSGPIDVTLTAGKRYVLAISTTQGDLVAYFDEVPLSPTPSFGRFYAAVDAPSASPFFDSYSNSARSYDWRTTTQATP